MQQQRFWKFRGRGWLAVVALLVLATSAPAQRSREIVMKNFKVRELDEQGNLKSLLVGEEARQVIGAPTKISGLNIHFYNPTGEETMLITSPFCTYDQKSGKARSRERVNIEGRGFTVEGRGFEYHAKDERLRIHSESRVELRNLSPIPEPASEEEQETP